MRKYGRLKKVFLHIVNGWGNMYWQFSNSILYIHNKSTYYSKIYFLKRTPSITYALWIASFYMRTYTILNAYIRGA